MGLFRSALSSQLSKYRKRKSLSLDGSVAGLPRGFAGPRHYAVAQEGWFGSGPAGSQQNVYGRHAHYQDPSQEYRVPREWFVGAPKRGTPPLRLDPRQRGPFTPRPRYLVMTDELMGRAMQDLAEADEFDEGMTVDDDEYAPDFHDEDAQVVYADEPQMTPEEELIHEMLGEEMLASTEPHPWYGEPAMTQGMFDGAMAEAMGAELHVSPTLDENASFDGYGEPDYGEPQPETYDVPVGDYGAEMTHFVDERVEAGFLEDAHGRMAFGDPLSEGWSGMRFSSRQASSATEEWLPKCSASSQPVTARAARIARPRFSQAAKPTRAIARPRPPSTAPTWRQG